MSERFPLAKDFLQDGPYADITTFMEINPDQLIVCKGTDTYALIGVKDNTHHIISVVPNTISFLMRDILSVLNGNTIINPVEDVLPPDDMVKFYEDLVRERIKRHKELIDKLVANNVAACAPVITMKHLKDGGILDKSL
jgi:hypothetical protein